MNEKPIPHGSVFRSGNFERTHHASIQTYLYVAIAYDRYMGVMERESKKRTRRNQLREIILGTVQVAGLISVAVVAPNVIGAMAKVGLLPSPRQKDVVVRSCTRLIRQGYLMRQDGRLCLTRRGEALLRQWELRAQARKKPRKWDGKWRVLIFDIPERRKTLRSQIRRTLVEIGFVRLQDSVWVYPYDCEDFLMLLKADFRVGRELLYMIVDSLENDNHLRRSFGL